MRFLANENFPLPSVRLLREAGHDVVSISEETPGITDSQVLSRAVSEQRIILTFDRDDLSFAIAALTCCIFTLRPFIARGTSTPYSAPFAHPRTCLAEPIYCS